MIYVNYHSHSRYCDGTGSLEDYVRSALAMDFSALGFSGHAPLPFPNDWTMTDTRLKTYLAEISDLKKKYKGKIELYAALEIDFIRDRMAPSDLFYTTLGLDYTIGSVHVLKDEKTGEYPGIDYTEKDMEQLLTNSFHNNSKLLVQTYYSRIREMIHHGGFTILGHLDVVKKTNTDSKYFNEKDSWYHEEIVKTLDDIQKTGIIMEVNTGNSRWNDENSLFPSPWIIKLARKREIPVVLNSDAHTPARLSVHFAEALRVLNDAGYKEIMVLKKGNWKPEKIEQGS